MVVTKNEFCKLSKLSIDNVSKESVTELFAIYSSNEIYILENSKLVGIITKGDYLRSLDSNKININRNYKYIIESDRSSDKARTIFYKFKNINSIPVLDENNNLLYSYYNYRDSVLDWQSDLFIQEYVNYFMTIIDMYNLNPPLHEYFKLNNFDNLFIFGNDYLCEVFSNELGNIEGINIIDVLKKSKIKKSNNKEELLHKIDKANILVMADLMYFDEYKELFENTNIKKISIFEILMSYNILQSINKLISGISSLKTKLFNDNTYVKFYYFRFPVVYLIKNPSKTELSLFMGTRNKGEALIKPDNLYYENELFDDIPPHIKRENLTIHKDMRSKYINVINGYRVTTDNPDNYENTIYIFGSSVAFGCGIEDKYTISSCLQRIVNSHYNNKYKVVNCGIDAMMDKEILKHINNTKFESGDIVIIINTYHDYMLRRYTTNYNIMDNLQPIFDRPHNMGEVFVDRLHMNWKATEKIAEKIFESAIQDINGHNTLNLDKIEILDNLSYSNKPIYKDSPELIRYLANLKKQKADITGKIGCIVVNCNPFTLGHLYLVEKSASMVDFLYIFVVEEENSHFSFKDRLELVKKGTQHLNNVKIIPSGKFIVSILTFPDYFNKETKPDVSIDPSIDIELFAKYIAPTLDIKVRFVGEEPNDYITRQYNDTLKAILPKYNIELIELTRKNLGSEPISASTVRKLLKAKEFDKLKSLVPITTYEYLIKTFK